MEPVLSENGSAKSVPIERFLEAEIARFGLSKAEFIIESGIGRSSLYNVLGGASISRKMARQISSILGQSPDFWLRAEVLVAEETNVIQLQQPNLIGLAAPGEGNAPQLLTDEMLQNAIKQGDLTIGGYTEKHQKSASYDLTLSDSLTVLGEKHEAAVSISGKDMHELKHLHSVSAATAEVISLPNNYFARVGATAQLAKIGIVVNCGLQIDPGFQGRLEFSIFNISNKPFSLFAGQVIASIEVYYIPIAPGKPYAVESFAAKLKSEIEDQCNVVGTEDGRYVISLDEAEFEVICDGPAEVAMSKAMRLLADKLDGVSPPTGLVKMIEAIARRHAPNTAEVVELLATHAFVHSKPTKTDCPDFCEGDETLRSIIMQSDVKLTEIFACILRITDP